jgi:hypothetical protein
MQLKLTDDTLVFFVDDTGHEELPNGHHVYGLAGCGFMGPDLEPVVRAAMEIVGAAFVGTRS